MHDGVFGDLATVIKFYNHIDDHDDISTIKIIQKHQAISGSIGQR